jgi:hypothetical protein
MTSLAHHPGIVQVRTSQRRRAETHTSTGLRLLPTGDGWSLVNAQGTVVFGALGTRGRRECLEFAQANGVLALFS